MDSSAPPPVYDAGPSDAGEPFAMLNIVPLARAGVSFVRGHLGLDPQASLHGEVQTKLVKAGVNPTKLTLTFVGVERAGTESSIELVRESKVLWGQRDVAGSSASTRADRPPESIEFDLRLTQDLPHCIHLTDSAFEYSLIATLEADGQQPVTFTTPAHLRRTSADMAARGPSAKVLTTDSPVPIKMRVARTLLHASEPVDVRVRVQIPSLDTVTEGLRLRTVSAELTRDVTVAGRQLDPVVLHKSGKSARFSPTKPVLIKLLVPSKPFHCESITQSTIFHRIAFHVRVTVSFQTSHQSRKDVVLTQEITFLPDPVTPIRLPSPKMVVAEARVQAGAVDDASEGATIHSPSADLSTSNVRAMATTNEKEKEPIPTYTEAQEEVDFSEDEYDGYEASAPAVAEESGQLARIAVDGPNGHGDGTVILGTEASEQLPSINDDTSPPSVDAASADTPIGLRPADDQHRQPDAPSTDHGNAATSDRERQRRAGGGARGAAPLLSLSLLGEPPPSYGMSPRQHVPHVDLRPPPYDV